MVIPIGTVLKGQYRIDALLGGGGMATVYRAYDTNLQKVCAIKQNMDTSPEAMRQFHLEAILLAGLVHPHLARVTDHFVDSSGQQYLVMDFVEGENLESYVARNGPVPEAKALAWMAGVLDAVAYCHSQGVIHRDIKPANLVKRNGRDAVVLVDFGIAKQQIGGMTMTGARAATPAYAPLEQFTGHTDARSDVYALGATLYFLLTGQEPPDSRLVASGVESVRPPKALNVRVSPQTEQAVRWAMALRVGDRPQSVAELAGALVGRPASTVAPVQQTPQNPGRKWGLVALAAVVTLLFSAALLAFVPRVIGDRPTSTPTHTVDMIAIVPSPEATTPPATRTVAPGVTVATATAFTATLSATVEMTATAFSGGPLSTGAPTATLGSPTARPSTSTPHVTDTPTPRPTNTPAPTRPTATAQATPTTAPGLFPAPTLLDPGNGTEQRGSVSLRWSMDRVLRDGDQFRVLMRTAQTPSGQELWFGPTSDQSLSVQFDQNKEFFKDDGTTFFWMVVVVKPNGDEGSQRSEERAFVFRHEDQQQPDTPVPQATTAPTPEPTPTPRS